MNPDSDPRKLIAYRDVQDAFERAATAIDEPPIVFDELWTEHRSFIVDPLLQDRSVLSELLNNLA